MRWSSLTRLNERRSTSKCPVSTVCWYTQIALMTIHRIGKKPKAAPSVPASSVWPIGIPYTSTATAMATAREISDATHAVTLKTPSMTKSSSRGIAATSELHARDWAIGSRTCWYTLQPRCLMCGLRHTDTQTMRRLNGLLSRHGVVLLGRVSVQIAKCGKKHRDGAEQQHRQRQRQE